MTMEDRRFVLSSANEECPACRVGKLHTRAEYAAFHPLGGHGYSGQLGPTHPQIAREMGRETKFECWNCHRKVISSDLVDVTYKGYAMFACKACKEELEPKPETCFCKPMGYLPHARTEKCVFAPNPPAKRVSAPWDEAYNRGTEK